MTSTTTRSTGYDETRRYVENAIDAMMRKVDWARRGNLDDVYQTTEKKREWVLWAVGKEMDKASGVLTFAKVYTKTITEEEDKELTARLLDAFKKAENEAWDL